MSTAHPSVKIADGTQSPVLGNGVIQATPSLTLTDILYVSRFPVSLLSLCVSGLSTRKGIDSGHERGGIYYLDDRVTPTGLLGGQPDLVLLWHWRLGHPSL